MALATALFVVLMASAAVAVAGGSAERLPRKAATAHVEIHDFAFHPHTLTVNRGTKVVFANDDRTAHTATAGGGSFATGHIRPGHSAAVEFERSGTFAYHCSIHNFMHGKIVVR